MLGRPHLDVVPVQSARLHSHDTSDIFQILCASPLEFHDDDIFSCRDEYCAAQRGEQDSSSSLKSLNVKSILAQLKQFDDKGRLSNPNHPSSRSGQ